MESTLYSIESDTGVYLSAHPTEPNRTVAWLFHDPQFATQVVAQAENPSVWKVTPVNNLEEWLDSRLTNDISYVIEQITPLLTTERTTAGWLLMIRAKQAGLEYRSRKPQQ